MLGAESVRIEPGATVKGTVRETVGFTLQGPLAALGILLGSVAIGVSTLRAARAPARDRAARRRSGRDGGSHGPVRIAGWGILLAIALPLVAVAAMVTIVGLPLGLAVLLAMSLLFLIGYAWAVFAIGRLMVRRASQPLARAARRVGGRGRGRVGAVPQPRRVGAGRDVRVRRDDRRGVACPRAEEGGPAPGRHDPARARREPDAGRGHDPRSRRAARRWAAAAPRVEEASEPEASPAAAELRRPPTRHPARRRQLRLRRPSRDVVPVVG